MWGEEWTPDRLETELVRMEGMVSQIRAVQARLVDEAHHLRVPMTDGSRTIVDWVAARLDVAHATARELVALSRSDSLADLESGKASTDRAVARRALAAAGASKEAIEASDAHDIAGVRRMVADHRRTRRDDERTVHEERRLSFRPSEDRSRVKIFGEMPAADGKVVEETLRSIGDDLPTPPDGRGSLARRNADALVRLCLGEDDGGAGATPRATIVVDARLAAPTDGEAGVTVLSGARVGPMTLEEILCSGTCEIVALAADGTPLGVGTTSAKVPPRLRRFVLARDGACSADGCSSTYRLEVHHVREASRGGATDADNLATLCWFHHHVVVHGRGFVIDPASPAGRIRFLPPRAPSDRGPPG